MEQSLHPKLSEFSDLLFEGGGEFNHLVWQVHPTFRNGNVSDQLSSLHEWTHHELNNVSSYGLLLTYFAFLARHSDSHRERFAELLLQLVARCQIVHEVYATWYSVELLTGKFSLDEILPKLPPDYLAYHQLGEGLVNDIESSFLRQQAFLTIVRSCFEAPTFAQFNCNEAELFQLIDIRGRDFPDSRLRFVTRNMAPALFTMWSFEYCDTSHDGTIRTALTRTRHEDFFDQSLQEADASLARFLKWLSEKWNRWLSDHGVPTNVYESHLAMVPVLVDDMNRRCTSAAVTHPLQATSAPHDSAAVLLEQMESEIVRLRPVPIPGELIPMSALPQSVWQHLPVGQPPHLFIQARSLDDIKRQHHIVESITLDELRNGIGDPLVFVRWRCSPGEMAEEKVHLLYLQQPEELRELRSATLGVPAYGLISSALNVDSSWWNEWLDPSVLWVSKIDHSLSVFLNRHCFRQEEVRYSTATLREGERLVHFITFLTRSAGESRWGLYIGFCGEHTAKACVQFITHKFGSDKFVFDREPFEGDLALALSVVATHMMRDEFFFSFNQLSYP